MKHLLTRLTVCVTAFFVGVCASTLLVSGPFSVEVTPPLHLKESPNVKPQTSPTTAEICSELWNDKEVSDEKKAVMAAQGFIALRGYTDGVLGSASMALGCVLDSTDDTEESYQSRYDTLEERAYGVSHLARGRSNGWAVVFKYTKRSGNADRNTGRAVTMDENFQNLRVEHCDFFLDKVEKRLR